MNKFLPFLEFGLQQELFLAHNRHWKKQIVFLKPIRLAKKGY